MSNKEMKGEGNPDADRRYRKGVRKTVNETSEAEREELARKSMSKKESKEARNAEEKGRSRARQ
jgi:hypothetical protein